MSVCELLLRASERFLPSYYQKRSCNVLTSTMNIMLNMSLCKLQWSLWVRHFQLSIQRSIDVMTRIFLFRVFLFVRRDWRSHVLCLLVISPRAELHSEDPQSAQSWGFWTLWPQPAQRQIGPLILYVKLPARTHRPAGCSTQPHCCSQSLVGSHCLSCFAFWEHKSREGHQCW